jgi:solute carrier family 25 S-adenosylmethionine transporter 26
LKGACLVRVPTEVIKQNMQVSTSSSSSQTSSVKETVKMILNQKQSRATFLSPIFGGLYRGYGITLMREIPFAMIQFPLYEYMKSQISDYKKQHHSNQNKSIFTSQYINEEKKIYDDGVSPTESAVCGSISGAIAAALTTPLDVIKTRLMIGKDSQGVEYKNAIDVFQRIMKYEGKRVLWKGIEPRVLWISIGGFVFFGAYEEYRSIMIKVSGYSS